MVPRTCDERQRPHTQVRGRVRSAPMDALWHFRCRWQRRPHSLRALSLDPEAGRLDVVAGVSRGRDDTLHAEARWRDPAIHGAHAVRILALGRVTASDGLAEWRVDHGKPPRGTRLVPVVAGFDLTFDGDGDGDGGRRLAEISVYAGIPGPDGHATAGVSVTTGRREDPSMQAALTLLVLAVPQDRLEVHTPSCTASRRGGIEASHPPLAATIASQRLRPLGLTAFSVALTAGHPERSAPRLLRELGVSINGLVLRWHVSTAGAVTRAATACATATVPCVRLD